MGTERGVCCRRCAGSASYGDRAPQGIAVNLSVRQLHDPRLLEDVADALLDSGLEPSNLTLEITESMLIDDTDRGSRVLDQLKALRVRSPSTTSVRATRRSATYAGSPSTPSRSTARS